jgi:hypothetical protein
VKLDNEPASVAGPARTPAGAARYVHSGGVFQILLYTPSWVFGLLAVLCLFGLMQVRTRRVAVWLALLLPAAMLALSLTGVLLYMSARLPALAAWTAGLGAASALCLKAMNPQGARYDAQTRGLIVSGSWLPLLAILGIFSVRYAMGVARAMDLEFVHDRDVQLALSLLLGAFSGFFLARGILFWRAYAARPAA